MLEGNVDSDAETNFQHPPDPHRGKPYFEFLKKNFHLYSNLLGVRASKHNGHLKLGHD